MRAGEAGGLDLRLVPLDVPRVPWYSTYMKKTSTWYSEKGTEIRPSSVPGMVAITRCGKFIALVPAEETKTK